MFVAASLTKLKDLFTSLASWLLQLHLAFSRRKAALLLCGQNSSIAAAGATTECHGSSVSSVQCIRFLGKSNCPCCLLTAVLNRARYDAACHLAEELPRASRNVPLAMVGSVAVNGIMGLAYCIVLLYCAGQSDFATAPLGFPYMQIYLDVTKSRAGTSVMSVLIILIAIAATIAGIMSTSRTLWAFARDKATPFDKYLSHVHPKLQIPVRSVVVVTVLQGILGFIYLGNSTAFNAILSMAIISMYLSYILPIIYMLLYGRGKLRKRDFGPFRLGRVLGIIMNVVGIAWMLVVMVFSTFPTIMPVTAENMNYSIVVLVGWTAFGVAYYVLWGKHKFEMPMVDVEVIQVSNVTLGTAEDKK